MGFSLRLGLLLFFVADTYHRVQFGSDQALMSTLVGPVLSTLVDLTEPDRQVTVIGGMITIVVLLADLGAGYKLLGGVWSESKKATQEVWSEAVKAARQIYGNTSVAKIVALVISITMVFLVTGKLEALVQALKAA